MVYTAVINNEYTFYLTRWDAIEFNGSLTLYVQSIDLLEVKHAFYNVERLEIFQDNIQIAAFSSLDTYSQITYLGTQYIEGEKKFADTMSVTLTKANIVDQVKRLDDQINSRVDPTTLSLEELKQYKLDEVGDAAEQDIFEGAYIEIEPGVNEKFGYTIYDQVNYDEIFILSLIAPEIELLPYHGNGNWCQMFTKAQVINICSTLMLRKTQITTYTNSLNMYIRSLNDRDALMEVQYGMELPEEYQERINAIMAQTMEQIQAFMGRIMPTPPVDDGDDSEEEPEPYVPDPEPETETEPEPLAPEDPDDPEDSGDETEE